MDIALVIIAMALGAVIGMVAWDLRDRAVLTADLRKENEHHKTAAETLMALHNKSVTEHAALIERVGSLEHLIKNAKKSEPILKRF